MEDRSHDALTTVAQVPDDPNTDAGHPAGSGRPRPDAFGPAPQRPVTHDDLGAEAGSLVTEYGLLAVVAATLAGAVISWASNGALVTLFNALLRQARALVGA